MTLSLADIQKRFLDDLYRPSSLDWIGGNESTDAKRKRLNIYSNGCSIRFREALDDDYPSLKALIGEQAFKIQSELYLQNYPSTFTTMNEYSRHFSHQMVASYGPKSLEAELAKFEWNLIEVHFGQYTISDSRQLSLGEGAFIQIAGPLLLQQSSFPLDQIYETNTRVSSSTQLHCFVFFTQGQKAFYETLKPWQHTLMSELIISGNLESSLNQLEQLSDCPSAEDISEFFRRWSSREVMRLIP